MYGNESRNFFGILDELNTDTLSDSGIRLFCLNTTEKTFSIPVRFTADKIVQDYLHIPVSETGKAPIMKWFCFMNTSDETYQKIIDINKYSIIEESGPKEFLEKWNLKIIK